MVHIKSNALNKDIQIDRLIANIKGSKKGPILVFFAGIHGNETAGVFALTNTLKTMSPADLSGSIYAIAGNLKALSKNQRYLEKDLNRLWTQADLDALVSKEELISEEKEQFEIYNLLKAIQKAHSEPIYFIDFHTTSSKTLPFITINDALINRKFSQQFPVPVVLGIEEYLKGPLLSYINQLGYVSLGFESGQHDELDAVLNCEAFIYLSLVFTQALDKDSIKDFQMHYNRLKHQSKNISEIFEITYLYKIKPQEHFKMLEGFKSFQAISKGTHLAQSNAQAIFSGYNARIFMPLYQTQGAEGFFIIKSIHPIFMKISEFIRNFKLDSLLVFLPGISWENKKQGVLSVNLKVTRFLAKQIFHIFGFRSQQLSKTHMLLYNRERVAKNTLYKNEAWFNK
ncbi:MAG: aspartoacylase [Xanthomarina sp.]|uniref:succinylglutamate desuccinylase/aspartoacylase family protein n=1 Tax=Xanthomarina sp. TaxID=1931211 RepID=UPI000C5A9143|nr:succinylglutamate desuccinylase/aspartoacylase family protein [Xanthomarina sp.]MAL22453.1 aspartoacylase [Xanthomarina sp.]MBF60995.1 aspartoacylase [Xanthomarina sp.]HAI19727.1 aspartoacylase [Xanthomarina gelatinilytica]|tara:strand:- start:1416 stop:2612 length:1197 start_codon:yes stop_codon:yes gene_type:complete